MNKTVNNTINTNPDALAAARAAHVAACAATRRPVTFPARDIDPAADPVTILFQSGIVTAITRHALTALYAKGNTTAGELLRGHVGVIDTDDLEQEVTTAFLETADTDTKIGGWHLTVWGDKSNCVKLDFDDDDTIKAVFGAVSRYMYSHATRHYKKQYVEIDGDTVRADDVAAIAKYITADHVLSDSIVADYAATLDKLELTYFTHRLNGLSRRECADIMGITDNAARTLDRHIKKAWEVYSA